jgi:hypothetical protein
MDLLNQFFMYQTKTKQITFFLYLLVILIFHDVSMVIQQHRVYLRTSPAIVAH